MEKKRLLSVRLKHQLPKQLSGEGVKRHTLEPGLLTELEYMNDNFYILPFHCEAYRGSHGQ